MRQRRIKQTVVGNLFEISEYYLYTRIPQR